MEGFNQSPQGAQKFSCRPRGTVIAAVCPQYITAMDSWDMARVVWLCWCIWGEMDSNQNVPKPQGAPWVCCCYTQQQLCWL